MEAKQLIDVAENDDVCVRVAPEGAAFVLNLSKPAVAFLIRKAALVPLTKGEKGTFHFPAAGLDVVVEYEAVRAAVDAGGPPAALSQGAHHHRDPPRGGPGVRPQDPRAPLVDDHAERLRPQHAPAAGMALLVTGRSR